MEAVKALPLMGVNQALHFISMARVRRRLHSLVPDFADLQPMANIDEAKQRFAGEPAPLGRDFDELGNPDIGLGLIFHGGHGDDVDRPAAGPSGRGHFNHVLGAFGEEEPIQARSLFDKRPEPFAGFFHFGFAAENEPAFMGLRLLCGF